MRVTFILLFLFLLISPVTAQTTTKPFADIEDEQYNFKISETADFTNYIDQSILITVEGNQEQSFSIKDSGFNTSQGTWIWGINQTSVENRVKMGILYHSGFNASSLPDKSASVSTFNYSILPSSSYNNSIFIQPVNFVKDRNLNVSLINNVTTFTPFITLQQPFFVISATDYISSLESFLTNYVSKVSLAGSSSDISSSDNSLDLSFSGEIIDLHEFTYQTEDITVLGDYNTIEFSGGFSISYDNNVLNDYTAEYEISYDDITILEYSYTIRVRSGSGGNINVGDAGITPGFQLPIVIFGLFTIPIIIYYLKEN